jgi:hypothetical protein
LSRFFFAWNSGIIYANVKFLLFPFFCILCIIDPISPVLCVYACAEEDSKRTTLIELDFGEYPEPIHKNRRRFRAKPVPRYV